MSVFGLATLGGTTAGVVACGSSSSGSVVNPAGTLTIAFVKGNDIENAATQAGIAGFQKLYPDLTIKTINYGNNKSEDITKWVSAGDVPDVLQLDSGNYPSAAASGIVRAINGADFADASHKTFAGLIDNVFSPMVGKVAGRGAAATYSTLGGTTSATKTIKPTGDSTTDNQITLNETTGINSGFSVYGLPKDFSTLVAHIDSTKVATTIPATTIPASFSNIAAFSSFVKNSLTKPAETDANKSTAQLGLSPSLARSVGLLATVKTKVSPGTNSVYDQWKDANAAYLLANWDAFATDFKQFSELDYNNFYSLRNQSLAVTPTDTKGTWPGGMYDLASASAVLEGNWYTPVDAQIQNTTYVPVTNFSGLYYSGWSVSAAANDVGPATKFIEYMTWGDGASLKDKVAGFLSPSTVQLQKVVDYFNSDASVTAKKKQSFLAHAKAIAGATPAQWTTVYEDIDHLYGSTVASEDVKKASTLAAFQAQVDIALTNIKNQLQK